MNFLTWDFCLGTLCGFVVGVVCLAVGAALAVSGGCARQEERS